MTMTLIETKTLGTAAASIEFTSIPQTFTDLVFLISLRSTADVDFLSLAFNSSTANFTQRLLVGGGESSASQTLNNAVTAITNPSTTTANTFSNASFYIPNYAGSTNKSFSLDIIFENNAILGRQQIHAGLWSDTAAITSISFTVGSSTFVANSTISLYGILKGTDGIVTTS
jgi:hypothetical protein